MSPRGTPDDRIFDQQFAAQIVDNAHINNMLWGFSPVDNQGRVMFFDTFNNGLAGWQTSTTGAGVAPSLVSTFPIFSPPSAVAMNAGVVANDLCQISRGMYAGKSLRIGLEAGWSMTNVTPNPRLAIDYNPITFPTSYFANFQYDRALGAWKIQVLGGSFQTFFTPGNPPAGSTFQIQAKVVCDFQTGKYVRAFVGDQDFDLSAYSMPTSVISYNGQLIASFRATSYGAGSSSINLGYVLVTKDEP